MNKKEYMSISYIIIGYVINFVIFSMLKFDSYFSDYVYIILSIGLIIFLIEIYKRHDRLHFNLANFLLFLFCPVLISLLLPFIMNPTYIYPTPNSSILMLGALVMFTIDYPNLKKKQLIIKILGLFLFSLFLRSIYYNDYNSFFMIMLYEVLSLLSCTIIIIIFSKIVDHTLSTSSKNNRNEIVIYLRKVSRSVGYTFIIFMFITIGFCCLILFKVLPKLLSIYIFFFLSVDFILFLTFASFSQLRARILRSKF